MIFFWFIFSVFGVWCFCFGVDFVVLDIVLVVFGVVVDFLIIGVINLFGVFFVLIGVVVLSNCLMVFVSWFGVFVFWVWDLFSSLVMMCLIDGNIGDLVLLFIDWSMMSCCDRILLWVWFILVFFGVLLFWFCCNGVLVDIFMLLLLVGWVIFFSNVVNVFDW